jgi:MoaA/NifB/PqqE/SkfB family radical SAM enzyme
VTTALARTLGGLARLLGASDALELRVGPSGPQGGFEIPSGHDGEWEVAVAGGRPCLRPTESSYYLYCVLPEPFRRRAPRELFVEVEYWGAHHGEFRLQYVSADVGAPEQGRYQAAEQRFKPDALGLHRFRRALFRLPDFDPSRTQNLGASFRFEFRRELLLSRIRVSLAPPDDLAEFPATAPVPELRKLPGRFYPIDYLFVEITNACNFKCTWCPDEIMDRRRGFMKKERVFALVDELRQKRSWLGPLFPVKLHQMGEPMLHPDLAEIVGYAESHGVPIELNTNCGLITAERVDGLYRAGLTNLILSYQTPDPETFKTRKAPKLVFDEYRDKVRLALERKVALGARTRIEIDIMNTKYADGYRIVSEDEQALAFVEDWIGYCRSLESRYGLPPRRHDLAEIRAAHLLDKDENGSRYELLDGVHLVWKRCHTWGNVIGGHKVDAVVDTYCPAPHDQFVILWNGDVVSCCTDYEGHTRTANVFASSIEEVWRGETRRKRLRDMVEGRLLDVCARCQGLK